jgi:hypothetical protein
VADRQTRVLGGNGSSVQAFTLDPGLLQYVQSVFVEVDNSAGADIQPTLTIQTNNAVTMAKKQQGRSIPAGDSGSATWALRLDDEVDTAHGSGLVDQAFIGVGWNSTVGEEVSIALPRLIVSRDGNPSNAETLGAFTWRLIAGEVGSMAFVWFGAGSLAVAVVKFYIVRLSTGTRAIYQGTGTTAASGVVSALTLDTKLSGTALLDISTPAQPKVTATDVYAVTSYVAAIPV